MYVGRKFFWQERKGIKTGNESNWREYTSSSKPLNKDIREVGLSLFEFRILRLCTSKSDCIESEIDELKIRDVLNAKDNNGNLLYYNKAINSKEYRPEEYGTPAYNEKIRKISEGVKDKYNDPSYVHPMKGKVHPNRGKRMPQTRSKTSIKGRVRWTNGEISVTLNRGDSPPEGFTRGMVKKKRRLTLEEAEYEINPKCCAVCGTFLPFVKRSRLTCSRACADKQRKGNPGKTEEDNPAWAGWIKTPLGVFKTRLQAAKAHKVTGEAISYRLKNKMPGYLGPVRTEDKLIPEEWLL